METNFFSNLSTLAPKGDWTMHIKQEDGNKMTVSIHFKKSAVDGGTTIIPPLVFPSKDVSILDSLFFKDLAQAAPEADKVLSNMQHYLKEVERASKTAVEQQKKSEGTKTVTPKLSKYEEGLNLAKELEQQGKYREAWMKVPDPSQYPDNADFLRKRKSELSAKFAPDIFSQASEPTGQAEQFMSDSNEKPDIGNLADDPLTEAISCDVEEDQATDNTSEIDFEEEDIFAAQPLPEEDDEFEN